MSVRKKLSFGCVALTTYPFKRDAIKMLNLAYENGITKFDTAPLYGKGYSEKIVGDFIKNKRNKVEITTKVGLGLNAKNALPASLALPLYSIKRKIKNTKKVTIPTISTPELLQHRIIDKNYILQSVEQSLKNLSTNYIDNLFLHEALPCFITDEGWAYLLKLKQDGIVHNLGIAAGYINLINLTTIELAECEFLQYENNLFYNSDELINKFPTKKHNYHSVLKHLPLLKIKNYTTEQVAGFLLCNAIKKNNTGGVVLFSTTKKDRLLSNLNELDKAESLTDTVLTEIIHSLF